MAVSLDSPLATRTSRIVLGLTVATSLVAAVAAAPSAPTLRTTGAPSVTAAVSLKDDGVRPLGRGPAIRVGRAYGAEDEDCTLVLTPKPDQRGRVQYSRSVTCVN